MVPPVAHFVWLGRDLPWAYALAARAAEIRGGFARVVLHHLDELDPKSLRRARTELSGTSLRRLDPTQLFRGLGSLTQPLHELFVRLKQPAAKSNLLRLAILAREGGVYLDTDVITLSPFTPLLKQGFFCGAERIALPALVAHSRNPLRYLSPLARIAIRDIFRRLPSGYRWFRYLDRCYPAVVNNAVMGCPPGHPFAFSLLEAAIRLPPDRQLKRFALGTHLLEYGVVNYPGTDLVVHPPERFYPLGPEISQHWFRERKGRLPTDLPSPRSIAVHWYASVRTQKIVPRIDPAYIRAHATSQLWSSLVVDLLDVLDFQESA